MSGARNENPKEKINRAPKTEYTMMLVFLEKDS